MSRKLLAGSREEKGLSERHSGVGFVNREKAMRGLTAIRHCIRGATAIEYALIASLISIAAIVGMQSLGNKLDVMFNNVSNHL
jgi:pilus assembly protein Flp/PilA